MKKKKEVYIEGIANFRAEEAAIEEAKRLALELEEQQALEAALAALKKNKKKKNKK